MYNQQCLKKGRKITCRKKQRVKKLFLCANVSMYQTNKTFKHFILSTTSKRSMKQKHIVLLEMKVNINIGEK